MAAENRKLSPEQRDAIIERIYDVAVDPTQFDDFVNFWFDSDMADLIDADGNLPFTDFDTLFGRHLERAQTILDRTTQDAPDLAEHLAPYANLAAFVVSADKRIEAANAGALAEFGAQPRERLSAAALPATVTDVIGAAIDAVLADPAQPMKMLRAECPATGGALVFRIEALRGAEAALVVSTQLHWPQQISELLKSAFHLTSAEQELVRARVMGQDLKQIALERGTSEGTVRAQIKSTMGKMNARSQTDMVRTAMSLGATGRREAKADGPVKAAAPALPQDWLEKEVWKLFKAIPLPDGRSLTYHEMGPPDGRPVLFSHMGSCMVRWSRSMLRLAFELNLRVICPIRAGYGHSDRLPLKAEPIAAARGDVVHLLAELGISRLPYAVQGTDIPLGFDLAAHHPDLVSELIAFGGKPCLPAGAREDGPGRWQRFFLGAARRSPQTALFAARSVMAMSRRMGPAAMLRQLCKDSAADLALLEVDEVREVLVANIEMMSGISTNAAQGFAMEYVAFKDDWSALVRAARQTPTRIFLADQDPTTDLGALPHYRSAYPWLSFQVEDQTGLAIFYQKPEKFLNVMAEAAAQ